MARLSICIFVVASLLLIHCGRPDVEKVSIKGSDTEVNVVLQLAEAYMEQDPDISIAVTGGGSGSGIAALLNGKTDIANSSRPFKEAEILLAADREMDHSAIIFALDALVLVTHPAVRVDSLSLKQIGSIFKGEITNWSTLGGKDQPISLYGRQSNSGTFVYFRENILKGEYASSIKQMNGTAQIIESIKTDPASIGYVGIGYVVDKLGKPISGIRIVKVKETEDTPAINPVDKQVILEGSYPIIRPLFQYIHEDPSEKLIDFVRFELSPEGQQIVQENGYFPITPAQHQLNRNTGIFP